MRNLIAFYCPLKISGQFYYKNSFIMKCIYSVLSALFILPLSVFAQSSRDLPISNVINEALSFSVRQNIQMAKVLVDRPGLLPKTADSSGNLVTCTSKWWTSGFFPGTLWYLYEYSKNDSLKMVAEEFTQRVKNEQFTTDNHDVGFMINCSFGNAYRITGDSSYRSALLNASRSLMTRFHPVVGATRSWNTDKNNRHWQFAVIIDNMMNLELLLRSAKEFNEPSFRSAALAHADKTMKNHFRPDHSSYHVVSYDTLTGLPHAKQTAQGSSDSSSWSRGQAWGLYGYTMMYRLTKEKRYLKQAQLIADFIIHHPNLPADKIPYWDFNAPNIPNAYRDASAGAITCSALIELSGYVSPREKKEYLSIAEKQIRALSSPHYRSTANRNAPFILTHSVGSIPHHSEIDVPVSYADYYFVEALLRMKKLKQG